MGEWSTSVRMRLARWPLRIETDTGGAAWYSADDRYRYALLRRWSAAAPDVWIMANPSTATASTDDPTIARVCAFSRRWGAGGVVVVNLFAYRSADPAVLDRVDEPVGPHCDAVIDAVVGVGARTVLAWGTPGRRGGRPAAVLDRLEEPLWCLTHLQDGTPGHPLYKPATLRPVRYASTDAGPSTRQG